MRQPAHDHPVAADHLLAIDAQILPPLLRAAGDSQAPGDQRSGVARPAGLHRQAREVDILAFPHDLLAWSRRALLGRHVHDLHEHRARVLPRIAQAFGRLGLLEECQQLAHLAQAGDRILAHAQRHPLRRTEKIGENGNAVPGWVLEQQRGAALFEHTIADFRDFQARVSDDADALEFAAALQLRNEVAQISVFHALRTSGGGMGTTAHLNKRHGDAGTSEYLHRSTRPRACATDTRLRAGCRERRLCLVKVASAHRTRLACPNGAKHPQVSGDGDNASSHPRHKYKVSPTAPLLAAGPRLGAACVMLVVRGR